MAGEQSATTTERKRPETPVPISPHADPVEYLLSKGWKCLGPTGWESSQWLDPEQPLTHYYSEEKCMYQATVREPYTDKETGERRTLYKTEERQILAQTGDGGALQGAVRSVFHPAVVGVFMPHALRTQLERDAMQVTKKMAQAEEHKRK